MSATTQPLPITEDEARVLLARAGCAGGYDASRVADGWLFTPMFRADARFATPWKVTDHGEANILRPTPAVFVASRR